jgi:nucleoside-diphosphate-sugar epimerase
MTPSNWSTEADLENLLSRPTDSLVRDLSSIDGDILILGASGKMGPTLARLAKRASGATKASRRVIGVARFADAAARKALETHEIDTIACDLRDRAAVAQLPDVPNIIYMAGQKFGTKADPRTTWAINVDAAVIAAERFSKSRIVAFSTGNVYPFSPIAYRPVETDPLGPVGEYAESAVARERAFAEAASKNGTRIAIVRLNYAVEPRYGVIRDLADKVMAGTPIDLSMGFVNVIWQRDANAVALRLLSHVSTPPFVLNVTSAETYGVRYIALSIGKRLGRTPQFTGTESPTALLSNAARMNQMFGPPEVSVDDAIDLIADWVKAGGRSLDKPTHFEERTGSF